MVLDTEKHCSNRLKDPGSLKVEEVRNVVVTYRDENNQKVHDNHNFLESGGRTRVGHRTSFPSDVLKEGKKFRKTYNNLTTKERKRRIVTHTKELLAGCVDKELLCKMGMDYFVGNKELAIAALNILDGV